MISWMISWHLHLWYHRSESMISLTCDIMGPWYHNQYHVISGMISFMISLLPKLRYHRSGSMISLTYDIMGIWYHIQYHRLTLPKHMIFGIIMSFQCVYTHLRRLALRRLRSRGCRRGCHLELRGSYAAPGPFGCPVSRVSMGRIGEAVGGGSFVRSSA